MVRVGRYTAALTLTTVGVLLLLDYAGGPDALRIVRAWWPAALVVLGIELIVVQSLHRKPGARVRLAFGSLFGALLLSALIIVASHADQIESEAIHRWTDGINLGLFDAEDANYSFDMGVTVVPFNERISIDNVNGSITLRQGEVDDIQIQSVLYVHTNNRSKAEEIFEQTAIHVSAGGEIAASVPSYGFIQLRKPRLDLEVTIPELGMPEQVKVQVANGAIHLDELSGSKSLVLDVKNGNIVGEHIGGKLEIRLLNGDLSLSDIQGAADLEVVNGDLHIEHVAAGLTVKAVRGDIDIRSAAVGGDWVIANTIGDIRLAWPDTADVSVKAKSEIGDITSDWPLQRADREAVGVLGNGVWKIHVSSTMDIILNKYTP